MNEIDLLFTRQQNKQIPTDREVATLKADRGDLAITGGLNNLAQAILNRLCTRKGELAALGHPDYGSRLYLLMGELNNTRTQRLAELYIRECLQAEPRIEEILEIVFEPPSDIFDRSRLKVRVTVKPVGEETTLSLGLSLAGV
ncbi:MAG: DUF2634 domain-containing protein [Cyanobacteriota bacterium]